MQRVVTLFLIYLFLLSCISWIPAPYRLKEQFYIESGFSMAALDPSPEAAQAAVAADACSIHNNSAECDIDFNTCKFENGACKSYTPTDLDCVMTDWGSWQTYPDDPCVYKVRGVTRNAKSGGRICATFVRKKC